MVQERSNFVTEHRRVLPWPQKALFKKMVRFASTCFLAEATKDPSPFV